jgi:hypothetical protein
MIYKNISIRIIPIILLGLLFASNLYLGFITYPNSSFLKYLIFGIVYFVLGILFISKIRFAELIGLIVTIAIFFIYPTILDFKNLHASSAGVLSIFNAIVMISCFILLLLKVKN